MDRNIQTMSSTSPATPAVSIGMPVLNEEKYLRQGLDSLLAQTFVDFELIISDNGSTDGTRDIYLEYEARDPRIRHICHPVTRGPMANFRCVLEEAAGEYFMWAAADDLWDADWLAKLVALFRPGVSIAFSSGARFLDNDPNQTRFSFKSIYGPQALRMMRFYLWSEWGPKCYLWYALYRRSQLRKTAADLIAHSPDFRFCLDDLFVFKMLEFGGLSIEDSVTFYKRGRPDPPRHRGTHLGAGNRIRLIVKIFFKVEYVPYLLEHIRRSPPGITQLGVLAATPIKYLWLICRGPRPAFDVFRGFFGYLQSETSNDL